MSLQYDEFPVLEELSWIVLCSFKVQHGIDPDNNFKYYLRSTTIARFYTSI